jgi:3-hydroxybutyryl-CoA dehydratase
MNVLPTMDPGQELSQTLKISMTEQNAFLELSGDTNPIHSDLAFAKASGFDKPVIYGGILIAKISGFLGTVFPGRGCIWTKLKVDFKSPLYVDETAILRFTCTYGNPELGIWELGFEIASDTAAIIAKGSVQVSRRGR